MLNKQLHPSTDIVTKWNVQWKKEKGTVIMKEIQPKSILWVQAGDFNATKKNLDHVLQKCQYDLPLTERQYK
jgi:hypothetical protein